MIDLGGDLTVCICTRDRPDDLACAQSTPFSVMPEVQASLFRMMATHLLLL
jgi:hypothetical protein